MNKFLKKKIPAFTLSEILVVLAITAIIASLAFSVLNIIQKDMQKISFNYEKSDNLKNLEKRFALDLNEYGTIIFNKNEKVLLLKNTTDSVHYNFSENIIVREKDTLLNEYANIELFFDGREILNDISVVDAIKINVDVETYIFCWKPVSAADFFMDMN